VAKVEERLRELGYALPDAAPAPLGQYVRAVQFGGLVFTSGHGPFPKPGTEPLRGQVGGELTVEQGQEAARLCIAAALASLRDELGDLDRITRVVKMLSFVNCAPGFDSTSIVIDGASDLLVAAFGEKGVHVRAAIGTSVLPNRIPVEVELIVGVDT
jgi:enamine deaminase RidA (YjgF/YER057c/UK114 family)